MRILSFLFGIGVLGLLTWLVIIFTIPLAKRLGVIKGDPK